MSTQVSFSAGQTKGVGKALKVGDYVFFGKYNNEKIIWRIIDITKEKTLILCSEKIISFKPFDAAESGKTARYLKTIKIDENRQRYGSNLWDNSNLREWLNSPDKRVKYSTQAPTKDAVFGKVNSFVYESGFLYNFTQDEQKALSVMGLKDILPMHDAKGNHTGKSLFENIFKIKGIISNYSDAYGKITYDKVSLLGVKEIKDFFITRGWDFKKSPTMAAMKKSERLWNKNTILELYSNSTRKFWFYWLRTPNASMTSTQMIIDVNGLPSETGVNNGSCGVVPVISLKKDTTVVSGLGSLNKPYELEISYKSR